MTREQIIALMCRDFHPYFDNCVHVLPCPNDAITPELQAEIYHQMMSIYDNVIVPNYKDKR